MQQVGQLISYYFRDVSSKHATKLSANKRLADLIREKIKDGMTEEEIKENFRNLKDRIDEYISNQKKPTPIKNAGLIKPGEYYFHSQLRKPVSPIQSYQDEDGNTVWVNLDEYQGPQMVESYSIDQLLGYYYKAFNLPDHLRNEPRDKGSLNHIINKRGIDLTLFMIDVAVAECEDNDMIPNNPLMIDNYVMQAIERRNYKINILKEVGERFELAR